MAMLTALCPVVVGRQQELSQLEDALLAALRGEGGVVVLGGEAGMGKTRLATELSARARRLGCTVISGGCSEAEVALPYLPFLEAIGNHLFTVDTDHLREQVGPAAAELAQLFPQLGRPYDGSGDPAQSKLRLFEAIVVLFRELARERGLLVVLEDLHWADPATRELVDYLTRRLRALNVLLLATYRTDELHRRHALLPTVQGWRRSGVREVELSPLDAAEVGRMVCAIFDEKEISPEFQDFLHLRAEGNPFVVEEMLKNALDRGDIFKNESGWDRKSVVELGLGIPPTVRDTILLRIERLSPEAAEVIAAASVVGRSFDLATLVALTGRDESAVTTALQACVLNQLLEEDDRQAATYRFRHALTREAVYEDLVTPRRRQMHDRLADVLARQPDPPAADRAQHLLLAGRFPEAVAMCEEAAAEASRAFAFGDAAQLLERALPHATEPVEAGRLMCMAGKARWENTESGLARKLLEEGIPRLEAAGQVREPAGYRLVLGRCHWELQRPDLARQDFERAREQLEPLGPSAGLALAYVRLSGLATFNSDPDSGFSHARRAHEIAQEAGAALEAAWALNFQAIAEISLGRVTDGFAHLEESYQAASLGNHHFQATNATYNAVWSAVHFGRGRLAVELLQRDANRSHGTADEAWFQYLRALVSLFQGYATDAVELARSSLASAEEAGFTKSIWRSRVVLAHALAETDRGQDALASLPPLAQRVETQDATYDLHAQVRSRIAAGDREGAVEAARQTELISFDYGSPIDAFAEAVAEADPELLERALSSEVIRGEVWENPRIGVAKGRLALARGETADAIDHLAGAVEAFRQEELLLDAWHAGRALARAEALAGERDRARRRLEAIAKDAHYRGSLLAARLARAEASSLELELEGPEPPPPGTPGPAEPSEVLGERLVSVLFCDVRGYTELTRQSVPAELSDRIASLQRWAVDEVAAHRGVVDKFAGDAVMATFNIAGSSVDHAVQALQAAIAIQDKAALAGLPVGAGLAVGPAVVGRLADGANLSVLGEVTNLAARLQAEAEGGQVLLSEEAYRRVREWLEGEGQPAVREELVIRGVDQPVVAYRVRARTPTQA